MTTAGDVRAPRRARAGSVRRAATDRGAASLWLLAVGLVVVAVGVAGAAVGAARVARHEARVAADLGALAGAALAVEGEQVACDRAAQIVAANGGQVAECAVEELDVVLTVSVTVEPMPGLPRVATSSARAGPVATKRD
ncbi:helicase/secretion neighborhood TadE-like protein [Micromonospora pattaloongensis]|uniref:Helicase/secretion neighborhood TadE-like protein n=1 Tax=Micromonospora pattaloongensis TaxID=405436 RepID=A0A1H3SDD1_9ACTN|nr:Rv3654c family TadE-like protein [Micromonospora pattaloongensis]SDZ35561.1 helicase/secretion neighborhood TadE-like protein [Micromonospora pattaloongensis]